MRRQEDPSFALTEALDVAAAALADIQAARMADAQEIAELRAENAALRDDRDLALARLERALGALRDAEAAAGR